MIVTPIKTHTIRPKEEVITHILDQYVPQIQERSVLVVTSKIISLCEGRVVPIGGNDKDALIEQEAAYFLPRNTNKYQVSFTITRGILVPTAGIDESNGNDHYILWPSDPQKSANMIREHIVQRDSLKEFGVIITDSRTSPLRWGVTATSIAYSGIVPLINYIGKDDLFGRPFAFEQLNVADSLAASAGLTMGEGAEQTPLALVTDIPMVTFVDRNPTEEELEKLRITKEDDLYGPFLTAVSWKAGKGK